MDAKKRTEKADNGTRIKPRARVRLKNAKDAARYIASCIKRAERGGEGNELYKRVCMASILIKALEVATLEERMAQIEQLLARGKDGTT
jgi:hypothetical protein